MKTMTRLGKGVIGAVVSFALFIGCLPVSAVPVLAATTSVNMKTSGSDSRTISSTSDTLNIYDDGGANNNYSNSCNGTLVLTAPEGYQIQLSGTATRIRSNDHLYVYDGSSTSATQLLDSTRAQNTSVNLTSSGNTLTLNFTSDGSTSGAGFQLTATIGLPIQATATGYSGRADGQYHGISVTVTTPTTGYTVKYGTTAGSYNRDSSPTYNSGTHTVYYRVTAPGYVPFTGSADVVFGNPITATATGFDGPYDGRRHGITVEVTTPARGSTVMYGETEGTYNLRTSPTYTEVGEHTVYYRVTANGYITLTGSATVNISSATMAYTANGYTGSYDGQPHGITVEVTDPASGATIMYGTTEGTYDQTSSPTFTEVGTNTVYYQITADNYTTVTGSEDITISEATMAYTASGYTGSYDGSAHEITVEVTDPASGAVVEYRTDPNADWTSTPPTRTDIGTTTVYYRISATGYTTVEDSVNIVISEGTIDYNAVDYTGTYDGQAHGITLNVTAPTTATILYRTNPRGRWSSTVPTRTAAGTTTVYFQISAPNYTTVEGSATITIDDATMVYTATGYEGTYDGNNHSISVNVTTPSRPTILYRTSTTGTWRNTNPTFSAAGTYTVYYQITASNYETVTGSETVTINPATIVYSAQGYEGTYDGNNHSIRVNVTTPRRDATVRYRTSTTGTWSRTNPTFRAAGTYVVYYQITADNYATVESSATVTISPADMNVTASGYIGTYDGDPHSISVTVTSPRGATVEYSTTGTYSSTNPTFTDVGEYTVNYRVTRANYNTVEGSATVSISNADMTVTSEGYSGAYDGEAHGITVTVTTPASGATVLYGISPDACTQTTSPEFSYGENTVYYSVTAANYNTATGSATVSISDIDIEATAEGYNGAYDGEAHGITVTVTEPASGATVMYGTEEGSYEYEVSPVFTEIGDYTVFYMITAEGHNPLTGSATVSIGELTIDATVTPYDGVFDGAEHGVTVTVNTPEVGATVLFGTEAGVYDLDESPTYCEIGTYTVYYKISAEYYAPLEGSVVVRISENPDRDNAREALIELIAASDEILGEWEDLLPEDLVEALLDAEDAAYEVLNNEIASIEQLEAAADNLANALGNVLQYIAENYETEPELTPEQRTRLCVINFVENLYLHALGRPFDVSGRDTWVSLIMDQGGTGTQVARGFLGSQEFLGLGLDNEGFVKALYNALFNRVPEAEEVDTWTNALAAGVTREEVINAFFASPEWARTCAYYRVNI